MTLTFTEGGTCSSQRGDLAFTASTTATVLASDCLRMASTSERSPLNQVTERSFSTPSMIVGDIAELDRRAVARGNDDILVVLGLGKLAGSLQRNRLRRPVHGADRRRGVRAGDGQTDVVERQTARGGGLGIGLNADGEFLRAEDVAPGPHRRSATASARTPCRHIRSAPTATASATMSEMNRIGKSPGLTLRKLGGVVISTGRRRWAMVSAVCTSSAAASMSRLRSNWMVMAAVPVRGTRRHRGDAGDGGQLPLDRTGDRRRHRVRRSRPAASRSPRWSETRPWAAPTPATAGSRRCRVQ